MVRRGSAFILQGPFQVRHRLQSLFRGQGRWLAFSGLRRVQIEGKEGPSRYITQHREARPYSGGGDGMQQLVSTAPREMKRLVVDDCAEDAS